MITLNNISELLKMQLESRSRNVHTLGPVAGSFQHKLLLQGKASEADILVSRVFAFVFSWYKVIIALSLYFSSWALQHTVHISILAAKTVSLEFFFELQYFGSDLRLARTKTGNNTNPVSAKYRPQTADCKPFFQFSLRRTHKFSYHTTTQK